MCTYVCVIKATLKSLFPAAVQWVAKIVASRRPQFLFLSLSLLFW